MDRIVRCPRCGSMDAGSVEVVAVLLDRMQCGFCGFEEVCDDDDIKFEWNESVARELAKGHVLPSVRFHALWRRLGASGHGAPVLERLRAAYGEPHRAYHDAVHIGACLALADEVKANEEVEAALWFHDAIYDTHANDNEAKSAELVLTLLGASGVAADRLDRIADHVRATKTHVSSSPDGQLVIDIDLSILGAEPETYDRFEEQIRAEYAWVPADAFRAGRTAVLRSFLDRPAIYQTPYFSERYEAPARANLERALTALHAPLAD